MGWPCARNIRHVYKSETRAARMQTKFVERCSEKRVVNVVEGGVEDVHTVTLDSRVSRDTFKLRCGVHQVLGLCRIIGSDSLVKYDPPGPQDSIPTLEHRVFCLGMVFVS